MKKAPSQPQNLALNVTGGPAHGQRIVLDRAILLGRDPRSRIPFNDERVSRHHAYIEVNEGRAVIRDLGSKNGTFVNGRELRQPYDLRPDDQIRLGQTLLTVINLDLENMGVFDTAEFDKNGEPMRPNTPPAPETQINRLVLRQATELASRLAALSRTRHPLGAMVSAIRREFRADAAGIFPRDQWRTPHYTEGEIELSPECGAELQREGNRVRWLSAVLAARNTHLAFPLTIGDDVETLFIMRRDPSRPFYDDHTQLADALVECMRLLPMRNLLREGMPHHVGDQLARIVGSSESMNRVREQLRSFAATSATVLIMGESGTGKELCARAIAQLSDRRNGPCVEVNCACILPELMEAELFGHEKGAYTNAFDQGFGKLEIADGGTLFLDEIGEVPLAVQAKLLRVLEGQPFYRVGGSELIRVDVRFICATNRNLQEMVEAGRFRADLYHRINILRLELPPLRERLEDLPELVETLMAQLTEENPGTTVRRLTPKAFRRLLSHPWPGNIRELRNALQRAMLLSQGEEIDADDFPAEIGMAHESTTMQLPRLQFLTEMMERDEITRALVESGGQKSSAARRLGISRPTLDKKIKFYGLAALTARSKDMADQP
jgi:DNA-binding NtrC family response regulator/pSer/pThr/pTyr-binding forkhead associated (FHA) protein